MRTKHVRMVCLLIILTMAAVSCLKNSDNFDDGPKAQMLVSNYVVNNAAFNVSFDNSTLTASPLAFGAGTGSSSDLYLKLAAGTHTLLISSATDVVVNNVFSLAAERKYSLFLYDTLVKEHVKILLLTDEISPVDTMTKSRFLQFIPNDSLTVTIIKNTSSPVPGDTLIVSDRYIGKKSVTSSGIGFSSIFKPGDYKIELSRNRNVIFTQPSFIFLPGKIYSLIAKGTVNGTGVYKEMVAVLRHN